MYPMKANWISRWRRRGGEWIGGRSDGIRHEMQKELGDGLRNELDGFKTQMKEETKKKRSGHDNTAEKDGTNKESGKLLLDSGASHSFLQSVSPNYDPLTVQARFQTANGRATGSYECVDNLRIQQGPSVRLQYKIIPHLKNNLREVWDILISHGPVVFAAGGAYTLPLILFQLLNLKKNSSSQKAVYI